MKLALVVVGDGRGEYLQETVRAAARYILHPVNARIMVDDSGDSEYADWLEETFPAFLHVHGGRRGMAGAVQAGFDAALGADPDYVFWLEEDMLLTRDLPIAGAAQALDRNPQLAQMCFKREPCVAEEGDDQLKAILSQAPNSGEHADYTWHDFLFSMNPCLIPKRILEYGWPSGPIGVGNEAGMTAQLLAAGYVFGSWGHVGDEAWCHTIGHGMRTSGWRL